MSDSVDSGAHNPLTKQVDELARIIARQQEIIQQLRDDLDKMEAIMNRAPRQSSHSREPA